MPYAASGKSEKFGSAAESDVKSKYKSVDVADRGLPVLAKESDNPEEVSVRGDSGKLVKPGNVNVKLQDKISDDANGPIVPSVVIVPPVSDAPYRKVSGVTSYTMSVMADACGTPNRAMPAMMETPPNKFVFMSSLPKPE
jgi:hypothetical protein